MCDLVDVMRTHAEECEDVRSIELELSDSDDSFLLRLYEDPIKTLLKTVSRIYYQVIDELCLSTLCLDFGWSGHSTVRLQVVLRVMRP
jgi:hypothetical protein